MLDPKYALRMADAQVDELTKIAMSAGWGRAIGAGVGALTGAGVGAATAQNPEDRVRRAVVGGLIGGVGGVIPGQLATTAGRLQAKQFGQQQLHGVTGYLPGRGIWGTKGAPLQPHERMKALEDIGWAVPKNVHETVSGKPLKATEAAIQSAKKPLIDMSSPESIQKGLGEKSLFGTIAPNMTAKATNWYRNSRIHDFMTRRRVAAEIAQRKVIEGGLTSIPGSIKGYIKPPPGLNRRQMLAANIKAPGMALGVGLPAAMMVPGTIDAIRERDPRIAARTAVENLGYVPFAGLPLAPAMAIGTGISEGARRLMRPRQVPQPAGEVVPYGGQQ